MVFDSEAFNSRLFFPRPDVTKAPAGALNVTVQVEGAVLHLRIHPAPEARCTILLFHGNGEVVADYDDTAAAYARVGAALAVVDFRGYGSSSGSPTLRSAITDAPHVLAALLEVQQREMSGKQPRPVVVMGRSLGSACAAELYGAKTIPEEVAGFIWESGSCDLSGVVRRRGLTVALDEIDPSDRAVFDPLPKLQRGTHPLLVIHGSDDELILPEEAERAYAAAGTKDKALVLLKGHGHNNVSWSPDYWVAIHKFLSAIL